MNRQDQSLHLSALQIRASRRLLLASMGGGAIATGPLRGLGTSAQTERSGSPFDALYSPAVAPDLAWAEYAHTLVQAGWKMNGLGTLLFSMDAALENRVMSQDMAATLGQPETIYISSIIKPTETSWEVTLYSKIYSYRSAEEASVAADLLMSYEQTIEGTQVGDPIAGLSPSATFGRSTMLQETPAAQSFGIFVNETQLHELHSLTPGESPSPAVDIPAEAIRFQQVCTGWHSADAINDREFMVNQPLEVQEELWKLSWPIHVAGVDRTTAGWEKFFGTQAPVFTDSAEYQSAIDLAHAIMNCLKYASTALGDTPFHMYAQSSFFSSQADADAFLTGYPSESQQSILALNNLAIQEETTMATPGLRGHYLLAKPASTPNITYPGFMVRGSGPFSGASIEIYETGGATGLQEIDLAHPLYQEIGQAALDLYEQYRNVDPASDGSTVARPITVPPALVNLNF